MAKKQLLAKAQMEDTGGLWVLDEAFVARLGGRKPNYKAMNAELAGMLPPTLRRYPYQDGNGLRRWAYCSNPSMFTGRPSRGMKCKCAVCSEKLSSNLARDLHHLEEMMLSTSSRSSSLV
mmetsp:Transcript_19540/g.60363  ORF Transcript_19540/g.60363 Transcript_19540/m.60363 type:complete len:120 (-) Transcript_19540:129-488(-)